MQSTKTSSVQQSGMDIDLGNRCSKNAYEWSKKTFINRKGKPGEMGLTMDGGFSNVLNFNGQKIGICSDGIGTKIELAERTGIYHTLGFDLMAMVVDDLAAGGFVPANLSNIIDVDVLDYEVIDELMSGLHDAANVAYVAISGGEIAELGKRINGYGKDRMHFNWCSTAIGILHPSLTEPINGSTIQAGDRIISLQSRGFRSNGFSAIRRTMEKHLGSDWHKAAYDEKQTWGEVLLTPSMIFSPVITHLLDNNIAIKGIAHITGGGIEDNFERVLKGLDLGADLDNLFPPHEVMKRLMDFGDISKEQAYLYWNMGNGMLIVVDENHTKAALTLIEQKNYTARNAGSISKQTGIRLKNI